jgi:hypothetical protein
LGGGDGVSTVNCMRTSVMWGGGGGWIGFVGFLPRGSFLRFVLFSVCFPFLWIGTRGGVLLSHGRAFGRLKSHSELVSLCEQLLLVRFSLWIIFAKEV